MQAEFQLQIYILYTVMNFLKFLWNNYYTGNLQNDNHDTFAKMPFSQSPFNFG